MLTRRRWLVRSGFTLIELITVIVILSIVAVSVGGPTLSYIDSMRAQAAASRLASDIRFMQRMALSSGLRSWVVCSTSANNYQLFLEDAANPGKAGRQPVVRPLDQASGAVQLGGGEFQNVALTTVDFNSTSELEFDSFGVPYDGNSAGLSAVGTVVLSSGAVVTVEPVSGFVQRW